MRKLEDRINEELVLVGPARAALEELRQHFPKDRVLYHLIGKRVAQEHKMRVPFSTIESSLINKKQRMMKKPIAQVVIGMYQQLLRDKHLDSDVFTINPRAKSSEIIEGIMSMVPQILGFYPFRTERDLARWLSEQYNISLPLTLDLFEKRKKPQFTRQVEMIYDNMDNMLKAAKRSEPYKIPVKYVLLKRSANEPAETINVFIDRTIAQLLGARLSKEARPAYKKYIKHELSNLRQIKDLRELAEQVKKLYNFPERDDLYRFSVDYADIRVPWHKGHIEQGKLTNIHRLVYVVALVLKSAKRKRLDISEYLPIHYPQYKDVLESVIERLKRKGIKPNEFGTALALTLGEIPQEIDKLYVKGRQPMSVQQVKALAAYK